LKDFPEVVPTYYFFISNGQVSSLNKQLVDDGIESLLQLLKGKGVLVLKHCYSSLGKGFYKLEDSQKDGVVKVNGNIVPIDKFISLTYNLHDCICTEYVQQHPYSNQVNASSLNTLRFLCVRDSNTNQFYVSRCFHRFGAEGSVVDNLGGNGNAFLFLVDIEKGVLKNNGMWSKDGQEKYEDYLVYPQNRAYPGMTIPNFAEIKRSVLEISDSFPFLKYIGWDVAITQSGFKIIEANSLTSLGILQREGGYLKDERLRRLFLKES
jgi:hypothetical protein